MLGQVRVPQRVGVAAGCIESLRYRSGLVGTKGKYTTYLFGARLRA